MENTQFIHSEHILSGRELRDWITMQNLLTRLSPKQSDLIIQALHQKQYSLTGDGHSLYLIYMDENGQHAKETTLDDIIDLACELSYEKMNELTENLSLIPYHEIENYSECLNALTKHCKKYQQLLNAYTQTVYCKNMNNALEECKKQTEREQAENASISSRHLKKR